MLIVWIKFIFCASVIFYAGSRLSRYGDVIAEKTGLGRAWIGVVLLAAITSLPELANNLSAVTFIDAPNLALGDLFGSCLFNILILAFLDLLFGPGPILNKAELGHILTAGLGIILIGVAAMGIVVSRSFGGLSILHVGIYSSLIAIIYLVSQRMIFQYEKREQAKHIKDRHLHYEKIPFHEAIAKFVFYTFFVVAAGIWLPQIGQEISVQTGWSSTFVGTFFLAISTSLPEIAVSAFALKLGAIDMAIGNLFGSNVFNMVIIFIDDVFYLKGPILANVSQNHVFTALLAIILTSIAVVGLIFRFDKKAFGKLSWDALVIILVYLLSIYILFRLDVAGI